jgi:uncharacterized phage-associated protein
MENTLALANFFIARSLESNAPITLTKLVKLVYIAHGWHLGLRDEPLLPEAVEAWKYGPIVPSVYHQFKNYASDPITSYAKEFTGTTLDAPQVTDTKIVHFLYRIWETYKHFDAAAITAICQSQNTPWCTVWNHASHDFSQAILIIPNDIIKQYYREVVLKRKNVSTHKMLHRMERTLVFSD